jgi:glycosyltransferase involved in cell wall biosynthesis
MKQIFIAWVDFQRRQVSMRDFFGYEIIFWPMCSKHKILKLFEYLIKFFRSFLLFATKHPDVVWVQLPQVPLLWAALIYKWLLNRKANVIADCHNCMFRKPWVRVIFGVSMIKHCDLVLVHNNHMVKVAQAVGIKPDLVRVLEDAPANISRSESEASIPKVQRPWFLFPASFHEDEPIVELMKTAEMIPEVSFLITGNYKASHNNTIKESDMPSNVHLLGYLPVATFDACLRACDVIMGLTTLEGVQLSVAGEAVGIGKPMVLSGTEILKSLFHKGAVFVDSSNPESIARGCLDALSRLEVLAAESVELREERFQMWEKNQARPISQILNEKSSANIKKN